MLGLVMQLICGPAAAQATPEYALKAAFIYNFALFTTWAERDDRILNLCVLGRDPFGPALDALEGKEVGPMRLAVHRHRSLGNVLHQCQIVFLADAEVDKFLARPEAMRENVGMLTISDREGTARLGIMIELTTQDRKIGFEFNQESARLAKVQVSSRLLRIARKVYQ